MHCHCSKTLTCKLLSCWWTLCQSDSNKTDQVCLKNDCSRHLGTQVSWIVGETWTKKKRKKKRLLWHSTVEVAGTNECVSYQHCSCCSNAGSSYANCHLQQLQAWCDRKGLDTVIHPITKCVIFLEDLLSDMVAKNSKHSFGTIRVARKALSQIRCDTHCWPQLAHG